MGEPGLLLRGGTWAASAISMVDRALHSPCNCEEPGGCACLQQCAALGSAICVVYRHPAAWKLGGPGLGYAGVAKEKCGMLKTKGPRSTGTQGTYVGSARAFLFHFLWGWQG